MTKKYSVKELADHWRVSVKTIYRLIWSGRLPHNRVGRIYRIGQDDIDKYLKKLRKSEDV